MTDKEPTQEQIKELEAKIDTLESQLYKAKRERRSMLRKTICDKKGYHDDRNIATGCWECHICGHIHWTL